MMVQQLMSGLWLEETVTQLRLQACCHIPRRHHLRLDRPLLADIYKKLVVYIALMYNIFHIRVQFDRMNPLPTALRHDLDQVHLVSYATRDDEKKAKTKASIARSVGAATRSMNALSFDSDDDEVDEKSSATNSTDYDTHTRRLQQEMAKKYDKTTLKGSEIWTLRDEDVYPDKEVADSVNRGTFWTRSIGDMYLGLIPLCNDIFQHMEREDYLFSLFPVCPQKLTIPPGMRKSFLSWMTELAGIQSSDTFNTKFQELAFQSMMPLGCSLQRKRSTKSVNERNDALNAIGSYLGIETAARLSELKTIQNKQLAKLGEEHILYPFFVLQLFVDRVMEETRHDEALDECDRAFQFIKLCYVSPNDYRSFDERKELLQLRLYNEILDITCRDPIIYQYDRQYYLHDAVTQQWYELERSDNLIDAILGWCMLVHDKEKQNSRLCTSQRDLRKTIFKEFDMKCK